MTVTHEILDDISHLVVDAPVVVLVSLALIAVDSFAIDESDEREVVLHRNLDRGAVVVNLDHISFLSLGLVVVGRIVWKF